MGLDFAWMDKLTADSAEEDFKEAVSEKRPSEMPQERVLGEGEYKNTSEEENAVEGQETALDAKWRYKRKEEALEEDKKRIAEAYARIQDNIKKSEALQASILKGIKAGEDPTALLFQALDAIARMTDNPLFYEQAASYLITIHGEAFTEAVPLEIELQAVQDRLGKLEAASRREHREDEKARISAAIREHREREAYLEELLTSSRQRAS